MHLILPTRNRNMLLARRSIQLNTRKKLTYVHNNNYNLNNDNIIVSSSLLFYKHFSFVSSCEQSDDDSNNYIDGDIEEIDALLRLKSAHLQYPNNNNNNHHHLSSINLAIQNPSKTSNTGHALLGKNGHGKTLLSSAISHFDHENKNPFLRNGSIEYNQRWYNHYVSKVSFQSHLDLLSTANNNANTTVYRALTPYGGKLSKAAQYLVVRFGLYPILHSPIQSISTGEIRKVLLIKSLSLHAPKLLVLDNAFDGLDLKSRANLKELVNKTILGFRPDMLVQDVVNNVKSMDHTQVMVITHRAEEIVDGIGNVSMINDGLLVSEKRNERSGEQLLYSALNDDDVDVEDAERWNTINNDTTWNDSSLPSTDEINSIFYHNKPKQHNDSMVIEANNLKVQRGKSTPISNLTWKVQKREKWLIAGGNGAGKSTLSRLLANFNNNSNDDHGITNGALKIDKDMNIGWVSTELHMSLTASSRIAKDVLTNPHNKLQPEESISNDVTKIICKWLNIPTNILYTPFNQLSQGEQKILLLASTIVMQIQQQHPQKNKLIILDEPCQGLDIFSRKRVLGLFERLCSCTDITFVYITHHMEEVMPSVTHVLHLVDGGVGYVGDRKNYNPQSIEV